MARRVVEVALLGQAGEAVDRARRLGVVELQADVALVGRHAGADLRRVGRDLAGAGRVDRLARLAPATPGTGSWRPGRPAPRRRAAVPAPTGRRWCAEVGVVDVAADAVWLSGVAVGDDDGGHHGADHDERGHGGSDDRVEAALAFLRCPALQLPLEFALRCCTPLFVGRHRRCPPHDLRRSATSVPGVAECGAATHVNWGWETGRRVDHRIPGGHVGVQLLRAGPASRSRRDHRRPGPAGDGTAAPDPRREPPHAGGGAADARTRRPHLVGAEGGRHVRLPGLHPPRGPVHADRPDQGLRARGWPRSRSARCSANPNRSSNWTATATRSTWVT